MPAPTTQYVDVSNWSYRLWWIFLLAVHLVTGIHNLLYALFYSKLKSTYLYESLDSAGVGMPGKDHRVIAGMNAIMAALHCASVLQMTVGSIWREDFVFSLWKEEKGDAYGIAKNDPTTEKTSCNRGLSRLYWNVWGRRGLLGVNGNNFYPVLITREIVEKALQMILVKRMSWLLSGTPLSWFYVLLLTLNCLTSVVTYSALRRVNEARRRFTCITCDCILNVLSCIAAPLVVALRYASEYDPVIAGFALEKWYNDEWSAHALNEFQMVVVVSRTDFACRIIFSLSALFTASNLKDLLRRAHTKTKRIACDTDSVRIQENEGNLNTTAHVPSAPGAVQETSALVKVANSYSDTGLCTHGQRFALRLIHLLFGVWGVVILALQVQASSQHELPQCVSQAHSWKASKPYCTLAMIDCHELGISGNKDEVEATWGELDRSTVNTLVIRHCPALEIPDSVGDFHLTTGVKIYNSTINDWGTSAAITSSNHPNLEWVHLLRVNMKNGVLPMGLQSMDFPSNLYDIKICYTNLRELPDNLDSKWRSGTMIYIEYGQLTGVPSSLIRLKPYSLVLSGNPITTVPPELFEIENMLYLGIGSTQITELPRNVRTFSPSLSSIYITGTNVSFFWSWIDPILNRTSDLSSSLFLGESPYCSDVKKIRSGDATAFSTLPASDYSKALMDPSGVLIQHTVNCEAQFGIVYPIDLEDTINAL